MEILKQLSFYPIVNKLKNCRTDVADPRGRRVDSGFLPAASKQDEAGKRNAQISRR
jgi:hypothetical protein